MNAHTDPRQAAQTVDVLHVLVSLCCQVEAGFRSGSEQALGEDVRALLRRRAEEFKLQSTELAAHLKRLDAAPAQPAGPASASPAPAWTAAHSVLGQHNDEVLLEACEAAEDELLERYAQAQAQDLEPATREALEVQRLEMRSQHELLRAMRDRLRGLGTEPPLPG